jgi:hypothetical protein
MRNVPDRPGKHGVRGLIPIAPPLATFRPTSVLPAPGTPVTKHRVNPPIHARGAELQEQRTGQADEFALQQTYLLQPGIRLGRQDGEVAVLCQPSDDGIGACLKEFGDRCRVPGS